MSTPAESEARAAAEQEWATGSLDLSDDQDERSVFVKGYLAALASRVSTPPARKVLIEAIAPHVYDGSGGGIGGQEFIEIVEEIADAVLAVSTPPSEDARVAGLREAADIADRMYAGTDGSALEKAWIGGCMATASAIRSSVQEVEGVAPVPAVPVPPTEPEGQK